MTVRPAAATIPFAQYRRAFAFVAPYWRGLVFVLVLGAFSTGVGLLQPFISRILIDDALLRLNVHALRRVVLLMGVVSITGFVLNILSSYRYVKLSASCLFDMRLAVYTHLQRVSPRYFARTKLGDIVSRLNNDIGEVQRICSDTLLSVFSSLVFLAGSIGFMIWLNWRLFLISVSVLPIAVLAMRSYQARLTDTTRDLRGRSADLGSFLIESLLGMRLIVAYGNEQREAGRFRSLNERFIDSLLRMQVASFLAGAFPGTVLTLSTAVVFLYGGSLVIGGHLTIGGLVAFMAYHLRLLSPVQNLMGIYSNLVTGGVALGRVFEVLDVPVEVRQLPTANPLPRIRGDIAFENVRFRYEEKSIVLSDVSFRIPAGSLCVLVGPSGAGKSTVADLLLRFYDPEAGAITIDGHSLRDLRLEDLRRHIAVVEQTPYLFHAPLRENLAYGKPDATLDEIEACARAAALESFVRALPEGYDTVLGERGCTVSAGERQRIALARALLRNPSILIMDEPTASLDPASEFAITGDFVRAREHRTTLLITHRMSLVDLADQVVVIEGGRIAQTGTPRALLAGAGFLPGSFNLPEFQLGPRHDATCTYGHYRQRHQFRPPARGQRLRRGGDNFRGRQRFVSGLSWTRNRGCRSDSRNGSPCGTVCGQGVRSDPGNQSGNRSAGH